MADRSSRVVSIAFTVTVIANFAALAQGGGTPPPWITYSPLLPLASLLLTGLRPVPPGKSKHKEVRYLDILEYDLDEEQITASVKQAASLPGWVP